MRFFLKTGFFVFMCGITGLYNFSKSKTDDRHLVKNAVEQLRQRGPDNQGIFQQQPVTLGHSRLRIIDTSDQADQPFTDNEGRFTIVYNGEIYNFGELKKDLLQKGVNFRTNCDTEVLLYLYKFHGQECLQKLNGFFAFGIFDKQKNSLFIARDRFGIKPLLWYADKEKFAFASEMKALLELNITKAIDPVSMQLYFQLNYIPSPYSIFEGVQKLSPGHYLKIENGNIKEERYFDLEDTIESTGKPLTYNEAKGKLRELLFSSVKKRLISDVPLGTFLSGGIDSSIITSIAAKEKSGLKTFSAGFKSSGYHDEAPLAELIAEKFKTDHTSFYLSNDDLLNHLGGVLDYMDEPFADSSLLAVDILSQKARQSVTAVLSGDGADEVFSGYEKHKAEFMARKGGLKKSLALLLKPLWKSLPHSRSNKMSNTFRQLYRFAETAGLPDKERYWKWASIQSHEFARELLKNNKEGNYPERKKQLLRYLNDDLNSVFRSDIHMVLQGDMLRKVDMASMKNSLEVRVPFLDHRIVEFANSLPSSYKLNSKVRKKILRDSYLHELPPEVLNRPKHGFEIPLEHWLKNELNSDLNRVTDKDFIESMGIFHYPVVKSLKKQLYSGSPGDAPATVWALYVFSTWYEKQFL